VRSTLYGRQEAGDLLGRANRRQALGPLAVGEPLDQRVTGIGYPIKEAQGGDGLVIGRPRDPFVVEKMQEIAMDLLVHELCWGLFEVARQLVDVVDVNLNGLGGAVAELKIFDQASPERSHGEYSRGKRGKSRRRTAATILAREHPGRKSF